MADAESFDHGKGEIFIRRGIFFSDVGEITSIAFLVFLGVNYWLTYYWQTFLVSNFYDFFRTARLVTFPSPQTVT